MGDAALDRIHRHGRAEFKNLDVVRFYEWLERGKINRAGAGRRVVGGGKFHVMNVKAGQPSRSAIRDAGRGGGTRGFP